MKIHELFDLDVSVGASSAPGVLDQVIVNQHFDALRQVHEQLELETRGFPPLCPGLSEDGTELQVQLEATLQGEEVGSHILVYNAKQTAINEINIMCWAGLVDLVAGRMRTPEKRYLIDYQLTDSGLALVTQFIIERSEVFRPVKVEQKLSLPK